jgi:hypothetical protein
VQPTPLKREGPLLLLELFQARVEVGVPIRGHAARIGSLPASHERWFG